MSSEQIPPHSPETPQLDTNVPQHNPGQLAATTADTGAKHEAWIKCYSPSQCAAYTPPDGHVLIGNCHVVRGSITVIGGPPGVGKSRVAIALAKAGATCQEWFSLKVHRGFKTLIVQNENGRYRLSKDFADAKDSALDQYIRITEPPIHGMAFDQIEFRIALAKIIEEFKPDVIVLDPWNSIARDDRQKEYLESLKFVRAALPTGEDAPALVIVAHTRKPRTDERASGRALLQTLAGSYVLGSVPRCAFVLQSASHDVTDERVVWTCCKNNDGEMGERTAWFRRNGVFEPCSGFDWNGFDKTGQETTEKISQDDVERLFQNGSRKKGDAVKELIDTVKCGKSAAYDALKLDGRFGEHLSEGNGLLSWSP